jgi:protein-S-isoprenylcysteine O-methyltransferase Ste14
VSTRSGGNFAGQVVAAGVKRWVVKSVGFSAAMAALLFGGAGTPRWTGAWIYLGLIVGNQLLLALLVLPRNPELLAERSGLREGAKAWDPPLAVAMAILGPVAMALVSGLDVRHDWIGYVPPKTVSLALALAVAGSLLATWAMTANAFFSGVVRIQKERNHHVVDTGPYRLVRHPGYVGSLLVTVATPYILGSRWAVFPSWLVCAVIVVRTWLEDRALLAELDGYRDYSRTVRYRLLPGVW